MTLDEFKEKLYAGECVLEIPKHIADWIDVAQMMEDIKADTPNGNVMSFPEYVNSRTEFRYAGYKPTRHRFNAALLALSVTGRDNVQIVKHTEIEIRSVQITDAEFFDTLCG